MLTELALPINSSFKYMYLRFITVVVTLPSKLMAAEAAEPGREHNAHNS
jgi:hypothetical protein